MQTVWSTTKGVASYAAETAIHVAEKIGLKHSHLLEIREKRAYMRKWKEEYGLDMYDAMMNNDIEKVKFMFEDLRLKNELLNNEIHVLEGKIIAEDHSESLDSKTQTTSTKFEIPTSGEEEEILRWCQSSLSGFKWVEVKDFSTSWYNGLAFAALLINWRPDLFDMKSISSEDSTVTLKHVFHDAEKAGIPIIINYEFIREADKKSILTQVNLFRQRFQSQPPVLEGREKWYAYLSDLESKNQQGLLNQPVKSYLTRAKEYVSSMGVSGMSGGGPTKDIRTKELESEVSKEPAIQDKGILTKAKEYVTGAVSGITGTDTRRDSKDLSTSSDKGIITKAKEYILGSENPTDPSKENLELLSTDTSAPPNKGLVTKVKETVLHHEFKDLPNDNIRSAEGPSVNTLDNVAPVGTGSYPSTSPYPSTSTGTGTGLTTHTGIGTDAYTASGSSDKGAITKAKEYILGSEKPTDPSKENLELLSTETSAPPNKGLITKVKETVLHHEFKDLPNDNIRSGEGPSVNTTQHAPKQTIPPTSGVPVQSSTYIQTNPTTPVV